MERRIAKILRMRGPIRPGSGESIEKIFIGITHPDPGLGREPVKAAQPVHRRLQPSIIENLRLIGLAWRARRDGALPFMAAPLPQGLIDFTSSNQPQADSLFTQLKHELRDRSVSDTELLPDRVLPISVLAKLG